MTDESYVFEQTVKDRKRTARGVYAKKGGSRSKRCSLPSDNLTAKQRKELNGPMTNYNLSKKMTWEEFLAMPNDLQREYIEKLISEHKARRIDVIKMFGISNNGLAKYLKTKQNGWTPWGKTGAKKLNPEWRRFVSSGEETAEKVYEPVEAPIVAPAAPSAVKLAKEEDRAEIVLRCLDGTIRYEGDPAAIFTKVLQIMEPGKNYGVEINFWEVSEDAEV